MAHLKCSLAVIYILSIWTECATGCGLRKTLINGRCCDLCPPGKYMRKFCNEHNQTVCSPCEKDKFSDKHHIFDRCEKCQSCQHEFAQKCTPTTNAKCLCRSGFLCSNNECSTCEENKCVAGEKRNLIETPMGGRLIKYSYHCEPGCPDNAYFDVKRNICIPWTLCSALGLAELFPGNKTHNSVCDVRVSGTSSGADSAHVILGIGFVLVSVSLLLFLCSACIKNLRKHRPSNNPDIPVCPTASDSPLSKEESGIQLIIPDECKDSNIFGELYLGKATSL